MTQDKEHMKQPRKLAPKPAKAPARRGAARVQSYHHGDLHDALLRAAETVLARDGVQGLTLRAAAREAGVSHAAPTHHFGDMTGLLSELAAVGFRRFGSALRDAASQPGSPHARLDAMGTAYVSFARNYPDLFMLMFRSERLDFDRPALREAMIESNTALASGVGAQLGEAVTPDRLTLAQAAEMVRAWSLVHGFAVLLLDHRLDRFLDLVPDAKPDGLLQAVLRGAPR
jgi:AcrR family transcriptional regulator